MQEFIMFYNSMHRGSYDADLSEIEQLIFNAQKNDAGVTVSNSGGWQSKAFTSMPDDVYLRNAIKEIENRLIPVYQSMGINSQPLLLNYWFNINGYKDYNIVHDHPFSVMSAVLYVKVPEKSGNLLFVRPDNQNAYFQPQGISEKTWAAYYVEPRNGDLIFFPSHIKHYVDQNNSTDDDPRRVSIAFNFGFK